MTRDAAMVRVWDLPTRLFHWGLAAGVVLAIVSARPLIAAACAIGVAAIARLDA